MKAPNQTRCEGPEGSTCSLALGSLSGTEPHRSSALRAHSAGGVCPSPAAPGASRGPRLCPVFLPGAN